MKNYWSCSKVANWIRGTPKPAAASREDWDRWHAAARAAHPVRYWIAEEALDDVQAFVRKPIDWLYDIKYYIVNRWVTKTHVLASHSLKPGAWHEFDTRLLHCSFDQLVDFVEVEQAWHHIVWDSDARKQFAAPWWSRGWMRTRTWRCPEAGLAYLHWASQLGADEGELTSQALSALETLELYHWWTQVRPARPDPMDASGWSAILDNDDTPLWSRKTPEEEQKRRAAIDLSHAIEKQYEEEDEQMLIRLVKLRRYLWT